MWSGWTETLADRLSVATGTDLHAPLYTMLGYDPVSRRARPGGGLISTPMARLRDLTTGVLQAAGVHAATAGAAMTEAWHAPDPVALAHPLADLPALFGRLRATGCRIAVATADDRDPTIRTLAALDLDGLVDGVVCADDGLASKPAPDVVLHLCRTLGVDPRRTAVVGDSPADLAMGRAAGSRLVIGVRTGVGEAVHLADADIILESVADLA
jgi:phosphoglycolate phosphatase